ncbi:hypothetical protein HYV10_02015 [Candidatus Dependentiae bacterium]|nr:hypothetical protein [Candidatus Dependentiae bacterium]
MKKFYLSIFLLLTATTSFIKAESYNTIKMSLILNKSKDTWAISELNQNLAEYIESLKKLSEIQKKRKLTIEELNYAYYAFIYIFTTLHEDYSGKIAISINDKDTLSLPFSTEILINLISSILQEEKSSEQS